MNTVIPMLMPIVEGWSYLTEDKRFQEATKVPGNWHGKWLENEQLKKADKRQKIYQDTIAPIDFWTTLQDNWTRFTLGAVLERWAAVRQGHLSLRCQYEFPLNNQGALQALRSDGKFSWLRGNGWNLFQFWAVPYHAYKWSDGELIKFLPTLVLLDIFLFPLDTVKTLNYLDIKGTFKNTIELLSQQEKLWDKSAKGAMFRGVGYKGIYNIAWGLNLWSWENESKFRWITTPLLALAYPTLYFKTRLQLIGSSLSHQSTHEQAHTLRELFRAGPRVHYSGFIPWAILNAGFCWSFPKLMNSEDRKKKFVESKEQTEKVKKFWT